MDELILYNNSLSEQERAYIFQYADPYGADQGYTFKEFNRRMRNGEPLTDKMSRQKYALLSVFANAPPLRKDITVYRGLRISKENFKKNMFKLQTQFTSTSLKETVTRMFHAYGQCCLITLTIPKGSRVVYITKEGEAEILLPPGFHMNLKVDPRGPRYTGVPTRYSGVYTPYDPYAIQSFCSYQDTYLLNLLSPVAREVFREVSLHCLTNSIGNVELASNIVRALEAQDGK